MFGGVVASVVSVVVVAIDVVMVHEVELVVDVDANTC